jgi:hypothetical protein
MTGEAREFVPEVGEPSEQDPNSRVDWISAPQLANIFKVGPHSHSANRAIPVQARDQAFS